MAFVKARHHATCRSAVQWFYGNRTRGSKVARGRGKTGSTRFLCTPWRVSTPRDTLNSVITMVWAFVATAHGSPWIRPPSSLVKCGASSAISGSIRRTVLLCLLSLFIQRLLAASVRHYRSTKKSSRYAIFFPSSKVEGKHFVRMSCTFLYPGGLSCTYLSPEGIIRPCLSRQ